jgi:DNA invertase Pin-like site-specific DNA recombinase
MLTTYSHTPVNGSARSADYFSHPIYIAVFLKPVRWQPLRRSIGASDHCHPRLPLWWFSLPRPPTRRACRLRLGWLISVACDKPDTMDRDGRETDEGGDLMAAEKRSRTAAGTGRRFAWYGRLSTKDKQDPTLSFPSQREACAEKAEELGGEIVCEFTDQEAGRRDDRAGWAELLREAKERDARRLDAVIVYGTSRLSRDLFHALTYEREMTRAGVEVFYALTAGDQTSPEGRLIRHMFQALDQFEVEKLGREVRRGQKQNTRQGFRNGGRAAYGYRLRHEAHPDPARAKAGDTKSRLVVDPAQAPVIAEMFDRFLAGAGYKEIANELNRPGGPPPPSHVDSKRNTSGKWAKTAIKSMLENPTYTGRLYWNRLDSRAHKQGVGPVVRREQENGSRRTSTTRRWSQRSSSSGRRPRCSGAARVKVATAVAAHRNARTCCAASSIAPRGTTRCECRAARAEASRPITPAATESASPARSARSSSGLSVSLPRSRPASIRSRSAGAYANSRPNAPRHRQYSPRSRLTARQHRRRSQRRPRGPRCTTRPRRTPHRRGP